MFILYIAIHRWCTLCWTIKWWSDWNSMCFYWCCSMRHTATQHIQFHWLKWYGYFLGYFLDHYRRLLRFMLHYFIYTQLYVAMWPVCIEYFVDAWTIDFEIYSRGKCDKASREHANIISQIDFLFNGIVCTLCACVHLARAFSALFSIPIRTWTEHGHGREPKHTIVRKYTKKWDFLHGLHELESQHKYTKQNCGIQFHLIAFGR